MIWQENYSRKDVPNFIRIARVL